MSEASTLTSGSQYFTIRCPVLHHPGPVLRHPKTVLHHPGPVLHLNYSLFKEGHSATIFLMQHFLCILFYVSHSMYLICESDQLYLVLCIPSIYIELYSVMIMKYKEKKRNKCGRVLCALYDKHMIACAMARILDALKF
jgi:hypothetical protein